MEKLLEDALIGSGIGSAIGLCMMLIGALMGMHTSFSIVPHMALIFGGTYVLVARIP